MIYLKEFATKAEYDTAISAGIDKPNVSLITEDNSIVYNPQDAQQEPKNFIKFSPSDIELNKENFTPNAVSIDRTNEIGIVVFDDNVEEITVGEAAFASVDIINVEFCENVKYINISAFDECGYAELKFRSMTPPEFIGENLSIVAWMKFNGKVYYPAGADYSSLRKVVDTWGGREYMFANFEFIEYGEPDTPSEPEVIECHFWIPNMEKHEMLGVWYEGTLEGDFSREFNELVQFVKANGVEEEYLWRYGDDVLPLSNPKVTINGYNATMLVVNKGNGSLEIGTDGPSEALSDSGGILTDTSIYFNTPIAYNPNAPKPESDVIEYHFEIPMIEEEDRMGVYLYGRVEADYSDIFNKLVAFASENGDNNGGYYAVWCDNFKDSLKISVNNDSARYYEYYIGSDHMYITTNGAMNDALGEEAMLTLRTDSVEYTTGI